jgi:hypothetical protein
VKMAEAEEVASAIDEHAQRLANFGLYDMGRIEAPNNHHGLWWIYMYDNDGNESGLIYELPTTLLIEWMVQDYRYRNGMNLKACSSVFGYNGFAFTWNNGNNNMRSGTAMQYRNHDGELCGHGIPPYAIILGEDYDVAEANARLFNGRRSPSPIQESDFARKTREVGEKAMFTLTNNRLDAMVAGPSNHRARSRTRSRSPPRSYNGGGYQGGGRRYDSYNTNTNNSYRGRRRPRKANLGERIRDAK